MVYRRYIFILIILLTTITLYGCYYTTQGYYLFKYTYSAIPIQQALVDHAHDPVTHDFLYTVIEIQKYADTINLQSNKKYNNYLEIDRDYLVAVVQAAEQLSVEPYKWRYLILGKLPYKGFYNPENAHKEAQRLEKKGYDTYVRKVSAFSTLNILPDPLYSFMSDYSVSALTELLLHEQVHATIWIPHQDTFNEQLATFIGREAALSYIKSTYGESSEEYVFMLTRTQNHAAFINILLHTKNKLANLYADEYMTDEEKLVKKQDTLDAQHAYFTDNYDTLFSNDTYRAFRIDTLNNAFFALISTYESNHDMFRESFERCEQDIAQYIAELAHITSDKQHKKLRDTPYKYLELLCN